MTAYAAPLQDMRFVLNEIVDLEALSGLVGFEAASPDLVDRVLDEAGKFAADVIAPLNVPADRQGCRIENGAVVTPDGFAAAYARFVAAGWPAASFPATLGGHGLPRAVALALLEMWEAACLSFSLSPTLTQAAAAALSAHGSPALKDRFLAKLVSGEWCGAMCLSEPQAGSDLGLIQTKAVADGDRYRITGTKIFTTYGDHDLSENIVHVVLARTPGGPPGVKGLSCFVVPKRLVEEDGSLGPRNDVRPVSLESKLGIHGSPTLVMAYGDTDGAVGYLIGEENQGLAAMFTMMNAARLTVGLQGVAIAERAYQQALAYAKARRQGRAHAKERRQGHADSKEPRRGRTLGGDNEPAAIVEHADVRRMLMTMRAQIEAGRALAYLTAEALDLGAHHPDPAVRTANSGLGALLTPVVKGWCAEIGVEVASLGVQIHGGAGYIEETGAAQHLRDARIIPIYEGTTGIQALDLAARKIQREEGCDLDGFLESVRACAKRLGNAAIEFNGPLAGDLETIGRGLRDAEAALAAAGAWLRERGEDEPAATAAGATPYLRLFGAVAGGWGLARGALAAARHLAEGGNDPFYAAKLATARFYAEQILPPAAALLGPITRGAENLMAIPPEHL